MSIPINNLINYCYYQIVDDQTVSNWLINKYLDWQRKNQEVSSMAEFARFLGVGDKALNTWVNGRNNPSYKKALLICKTLDDYSLLDLLGYPRPALESRISSFRFLPSDLQERFISALDEIEETLKTRSIQPDSEEGREISSSVLKKFGVRFNSNSKG